MFIQDEHIESDTIVSYMRSAPCKELAQVCHPVTCNDRRMPKTLLKRLLQFVIGNVENKCTRNADFHVLDWHSFAVNQGSSLNIPHNQTL
jgi:hypothetical protein